MVAQTMGKRLLMQMAIQYGMLVNRIQILMEMDHIQNQATFVLAMMILSLCMAPDQIIGINV